MTMSGVSDRDEGDALYEEDFAAWLDVQAAALRERRVMDLDLDNLIEEVESIRRAELRSVEHHAQIVIAQLLQLARSTDGDPRWSWKSTAMAHRHQLEMSLSPTLRQELQARLERSMRGAARSPRRYWRPRATPHEWLPQRCPYTLAEILADDWFPINVYGIDRLER
jgi:Domain of unknown function DUF29